MSAPQTLSFTTLDVFTTQRYAGNQLAVVDLPSATSLTQTQKQAIAREFNLSETVFLHLSPCSPWTIDIFTRLAELPLAGHPTIGSATLLGLRHPELTSATLHTKAGPVAVTYSRDGGGRLLRAAAVLPHDPHVHSTAAASAEVLRTQQGLGHDDLLLHEGACPVVSIVKGMTFVLVRVASREALRRVEVGGVVNAKLDAEYAPSFTGMYFFYEEQGSTQGVKVHARMISEATEDPATGSAASALSVWLALREKHSTKVEIVQGEDMGRRSEIGVHVEMHGDAVDRVTLEGSAVEVMQGSLVV